MRPAEQVNRDIVARGAPDDSSIGVALGVNDSQVARACRPPARTWRSLRAYWVTFLVIASYLSVRVQARFRSENAIERLLRRKHRTNAGRIERTIVHLQGLYIKVGQLISIMTNFLPPEFREQLEGLQDQVPPRPYEDIERRFREEFDGRSPDELFESFDRQPIASASIGQVHVARLAGGQRVAVKVQYPDIEEIVRSDLRTVRRILRIVQNFVPYQGLEDVYHEIRSMLHAELDFRAEADNLETIAQNFSGRDDVVFPLVVRELSTQRVLTTHFENGIKVGDLGRIDRAGIDRAALARMVVGLYCQQIFSDGVYHADPHPGNLLARQAPGGALTVVFLDFGAVAHVSAQMRQGLVELLQGALARDTPRIVRAMKKMGFIARGADDGVFDRVIEYFHSRFQEQLSLDSLSLKDIKFDPQKGLDNLADLRRMDISLRELSSSFHVPKEWILLERTLLLLMGLCTALDPQMNPMTVVRPYLERFVLGEEGNWQGFAVETAKDMFLSLTALPSDIRKFVASAKTGELSVKFHNLDRSTRLMYRLGHQVITAAIGITGAAIAIVLEGRGDVDRAEYGWWTMKIAAALLIWSWWSSRHLLRRK
ncbi:MAG TPA: AarF/UbiB family protein [Candidatus Acidoferrum sp.]|nr:AarF/UbiB family protein [Candidatus Acidoferrum sp.]